MSRYLTWSRWLSTGALCCLAGFAPALGGAALAHGPDVDIDKFVMVRAALRHTHTLLERAAMAASRTKAGQPAFRAAVVQQRAARLALRQRRGAAAVHLTLRSRASARQALAANPPQAVRDQAADSPGEIKAAASVRSQQVQGYLDQAAKEVGSAERCARAADVCDKED